MIHDVFADLRLRFRTADLVPGFELLNVLGHGGQGVVFRARKTAIGKTYVVKFLRPAALGDPHGFHASEIEHLSALAELRHPHLVAVEDKGEAEGFTYLVMEFAGESTLRSLLRETNVELEGTLRIVDEVAQALQHLHAHGVLHLDVKPSNVFILDGRAKLGDFGLVRIADHSGPIDLTSALGTPPYVAPEVVTRGQASTASDVYGLGRILDDVLIASCSRSGFRPQEHLVELINAATLDEPARRPALVTFRERLKGASAATFRQITFRSPRADSGHSSRQNLHASERGAPARPVRFIDRSGPDSVS